MCTKSAIIADRLDDTRDQLCHWCRGLTTYKGLQDLIQTGSFQHLRFEDVCLNAEAERPCSVCVVIAKKWMQRHLCQGRHIWPRWDATVKLRLEDKTGSDLTLGFMAYVGGKAIKHTFYLLANEEDPAASLTRRQPPLTEVASDQVFELARAWLNDCEENHTKCSRSNFIPKLPTYVVDVSPPSSSGIARLYKPAEGERAKYLCLSYCWGTTGQATTTQTTLKAFLQELPISRLGLTIQDAIETTRRLGFQYLWVDALCIVQDDSTQKHVEIKAMSHTYKNATAVICAAAASASSDGFLRMDRGIYKPSPPLPFEFQVDLPGDVTGNLTLVQAEKFDQVDPLDKRAWALQETLLSARKFVFSSAELLVECREHNRRAFRESYINYAAHVYNSVPAISTWNWNTVDCTNRWFKLLVEYSQRSLTDRNDRLDAFQGIADEIQELSGKPVRYGIPEFASATPAWRTTMPALTRSDRAPSWSWGCLDSHVQFTDHAYYKSKATIRFPSDDESKMGLTACMISGADWTRSLDRDTTWWPDLTVGLPRPLSRFYLLLGYWNGNGDSNADDGLVLESVGDGVYRRTGAFMTKAFQGSWPAQPQEITLV